ncbi:MAG: hypothetical protein ISR64_07120 [Deltaproteobacteria bacterium]|nr:hypothetical protein [Deltaproteobacteria bacterium]
MADETRSFKRLNFFRGFLTTEDDWNDGENYHIGKRTLHNRVMHAPGVVPQFLGGFAVGQRGRGDLNVEVAAGYGVDGNGRDIFLPEPVIKTVNPKDFRLPQTVYVVASYSEEPTDFVAYKENIQFKGHKRIEEGVKIEVTAREPDVEQEVELARIALDKGVKQIKDALDPMNPRPNEIDLRFVPAAGVSGSFLNPQVRAELHELLAAKQLVYSHLAHVLKVGTALDVLHAVITLEMLLVSGYVDYRNIFHLLATLLSLQKSVIDEVEKEHKDLSKKKEFGTYKWNVESVKLDRRYTMELLVDILTTQKNATEALRSLFSQALRPKARKKAEVPSEVIWDKIKVRSADFPKNLSVEGRDFKRVDIMDIFDEKSEKQHHFLISEERDRYRSRQKLKYPDGTETEDVGVHFEGGHCSLEVMNIEPNRDVLMIMRIDYVRGDYECEVHVNGKKAPELAVPGNDMRFRWRNWPYVIPAELATEPILRVDITPAKADRDVNFFKVWVYQPK